MPKVLSVQDLNNRRELARLRYLQNPEVWKKRSRIWKLAHAHRVKELDHIRYVAKREQQIEKVRIWRMSHKPQVNASARRRYAADPEKHYLRQERRRAEKFHSPLNDLTALEWRTIKTHYGHRCVYCNRKMQRLTQDHIIPLSKGGSHTASNIVPACHSCNSKKGNRAPLIPVQPLLLVPLLKEVPSL